MEIMVTINFTKRFGPYEDDEKWMELNNQYANYSLKFEISERGDLSIVTNLENVFNNGYTSCIIRDIIAQTRDFESSLLYRIGLQNPKSTLIMQGSDIIDIYYNPELSSEDIGKYFLDRKCHNACVMMNFKMYDVAAKEEKRGYIELRDRIMSLFQCTLYDDNSIAVIETKGDNFVKEKIKKICSLYMCEIDSDKRMKTLDRYFGFGTVIKYAFMQDEYTYVSMEIL